MPKTRKSGLCPKSPKSPTKMTEASQKQISVNDFTKICRICLSSDQIIPIFDVYISDVNTKAVELLELCLLLQVNSDDCLPQNLCKVCIEELFRIYTFKEQCHENDKLLRSVLEKSEAADLNKKQNEVQPSEEEETIVEKKSPKRKKLKVNPLKCRNCPESFKSEEDLINHRKAAKHPKGRRTYNCSICSKPIASGKLKLHMRSHTKEKPFQCEICSMSFSIQYNLRRHVMTHTGERPYVCSTCGKSFIQATTLHDHEKTHTGERPHVCSMCGKGYIQIRNLHNHERTHLSGPAKRAEVGSGQFKCEHCGRIFSRLAPFNMHLRTHNPDHKIDAGERDEAENELKPFFCNTCNKGYTAKHILKAHQLRHGEKSFLCSDCGKGFFTNAALQNHLKVHTGEKPHTCVVCQKSFASDSSFARHMLIHTGQKPYSCTLCPKSFRQISHLNHHLRTHKGERPYACSYCGKSFALNGNLTVHMRTHTGETPYLCTVCGKGFRDSSGMNKHKKIHKEDETQNVINVTFQVVSDDSDEQIS